VFVNRQLAIDLGGVHSRETATVNLDDQRGRFGIDVGGTYPLHVFFAERHTVASDFEVETEIGTEPSCP
jgi:fibro-slime domain-containing protein